MLDAANLLIDLTILESFKSLVAGASHLSIPGPNLFQTVLEKSKIGTTSIDGKPLLDPSAFNALISVEKLGLDPLKELTNLKLPSFIPELESSNPLTKRKSEINDPYVDVNGVSKEDKEN